MIPAFFMKKIILMVFCIFLISSCRFTKKTTDLKDVSAPPSTELHLPEPPPPPSSQPSALPLPPAISSESVPPPAAPPVQPSPQPAPIRPPAGVESVPEKPSATEIPSPESSAPPSHKPEEAPREPNGY